MDGKEHVICGDAIKTILHGMVHSLQKLMANGLTMFMMQMVKVTDSLPLNAIVGEHTQELEHLLTEYQQIFQVPTTLPLPRSHEPSNQFGAQHWTCQCAPLLISPHSKK